MNPLARERRSRDTRPQPAWRHPATPCKTAQPPPPPAMKRLALLLLFALAALACGCCVLPIPVYYTHGPGVSGKVLEAGTENPIHGAKVLVRSQSVNCPDRYATTKEDGSFRVSPDWDIHFGVWAGPRPSGTCIPFALFDNGDGISRRFFSVSIEAEGYESDDWGEGRALPSNPDHPERLLPAWTPPLPEDGIYRLHPLGTLPDSDGDGLLDRDELRFHFTDFHNADTDGDGVFDGDEVKAGTNPLDLASYPATNAPAPHADSADGAKEPAP